MVKEETTVLPKTQITTVGSKVAKKAPVTARPAAPVRPASSCDSNYSGARVPIANDVDCSGGSGNGPAYVHGTVRMTGSDIYDLDRDGDGYGCD